MKFPAFYKNILEMPKLEATDYLFDCLVEGGEAAWHLMEDINGEEWTSNNGQSIVRTTVEKLHEKYGGKSESRVCLN